MNRIAKINEAVFNIVYAEMCESLDVERIYIYVVANKLVGGEKVLSNWVPPHLESHIKYSKDVWTIKLAVSPAAVKYLMCSDQVLSFECRISGKVSVLNITTDQLLQVFGVRQEVENGSVYDKIVDAQDFPAIVYDDGAPVVEKKRPTLTVVK
jgi:stringent starvation protein B